MWLDRPIFGFGRGFGYYFPFYRIRVSGNWLSTVSIMHNEFLEIAARQALWIDTICRNYQLYVSDAKL